MEMGRKGAIKDRKWVERCNGSKEMGRKGTMRKGK